MTQSKVSLRKDYTRLAFAAVVVLGLPACTAFGTKDDEPAPAVDIHAQADTGPQPAGSGPRTMSSDQSTLAAAVAQQRGTAPTMRSGSTASAPRMAAPVDAPAATVSSSRGTTVQLAEGAPAAYVVKKGDTLWAISAMYLRDPWLWPELWKLNPQIQNPHLIYPGDQVSLTFVDGQAQLSVSRGGEVVATTGAAPTATPAEPAAAPSRDTASGSIRVTPKIRTTPLEDAVTFLPIDVIRPFLTQTGILDPEIVEKGPYIFGAVDNRVLMGPTDRAYVRRIPEGETHYTIVRLGKPYEDPVTEENLGYAAMYIGEGQVELHGDPGIVRISSSKIEALKGDYLVTDNLGLPTESYQPRPPRVKIDGQIIDVVGGVANIGSLQVVVLNKGTQDGLQPGDVLLVLQNQGERRDAKGGFFGEDVALPDSRTGELMVFRTYNRLSYALIMRAESEIRVGDKVRSP